MLSYRHQGDYFEGDKVSFKYEGRNTRLSYLGFLSKRTQSLVVFHGQKKMMLLRKECMKMLLGTRYE